MPTQYDIKTLSLQLPQASHRYHFVKAKVRVHEYPDGGLAVFHGPRKLGTYTKTGQLIIEQGQEFSDVTRFTVQKSVDMMDKGLTPLDHISTDQQQSKRTINVL